VIRKLQEVDGSGYEIHFGEEEGKGDIEGEIQEKQMMLPIADLTRYLREDKTVLATQFVADFKKQMKSNYESLSNTNLTVLRHSIKNFVANQQMLMEHAPDTFQEEAIHKKLCVFYKDCSLIKDILADLSTLLEGHLQFVQTVLENIHLDSFSDIATTTGLYFSKHKQRLAIFELPDGQYPPFPLKIPYFMELNDGDVDVMNETDYLRWKNEYKKLLTNIVSKLEEAIPKKWPQTIPNLSTYNGKPLLLVRDPEDFCWIMSSYHLFISKMELLNNDWTVTLRVLYPSLLMIQKGMEGTIKGLV